VQGRRLEAGEQRREVRLDRILLEDAGRDAVPADARDRALVEEIEQLLALDRAEVEAVAAHELERVPLGRVVAAGDRDAPARPEPRHGELQARRRADAEVAHLAADREQARGDRRLQHRAGGPGVAADEHPPPVDVGAESLGEAHDQLRGERLADHPAHAGDPDLEGLHPR
jgi:hypothetical protein